MSAALDSGSIEIDLEEDSPSGVTSLGVGSFVAQRYHLKEVIGRGAVATVWRARDVLLDREVALKLLSQSDDDDPARFDRVLREARICAAIRHPNVVDLLDFGTCGGRPFLVLELLEGEALDARLERRAQLGVDEAVAIAIGMLDGLEAAHTAGVVHRDLKPANVFLVEEPGGVRPKIVDFGVSRSVDRSRRSARTTAEGQLFGTPAYMSPEQARGSRAVDARTDLYSAAVIVYECLAGVLPYESEALGDLIVEIVTSEAPPLSRVRPDVGPISDVLARAMAHRPEHRFASAREMREALVEAAEHLRRDRSAPTIPVRTPPVEEDERTVVDVAPARPVRPPRRIDVRRVGGPRGPDKRGRASVWIGGLFVVLGALVAAVHVVPPAVDHAPDPIRPGPRVRSVRVVAAPEPEVVRAEVAGEWLEVPAPTSTPAVPRASRPARPRAEPRPRAAAGDQLFRELDY